MAKDSQRWPLTSRSSKLPSAESILLLAMLIVPFTSVALIQAEVGARRRGDTDGYVEGVTLGVVSLLLVAGLWLVLFVVGSWP